MTSQQPKNSTPDDGKSEASAAGLEDGEPPYIEVFGRKYHHSGRIFVPFDEKEQQRMELSHRLYRHCLNGALTTTRIPLNVKSIVDLGSGTGVWPLEMAARYPQADILGIDISRIQKTNAVPPNVRFHIDNVENPWPVPANSIDFLHIRCLSGGVTDWQGLLRQAYEKLKPGGLLEWTEMLTQLFDFDGKFGHAKLCPKFLDLWRDLTKRNNIEFNPSPNGPLWLVDAGFENIAQRNEILPLGDWAQDEKLHTRQTLMNVIVGDHIENHCGLVFVKSGWTREQFDAVTSDFLIELLQSKTARPYTTLIFTTARKPR
ncbi:S-adenosyl-L-methionine-dependent methyltransferase [Xylaria nigripes]|nr:S-adenosyl-L-methionine-dependent methyltransferase [Xylaria nigripes]